MKIYFAGARKNHINQLRGKPVLLSFAYNPEFWTEFRDMILDCGAFSTWKSGKEFDFLGYVDYVNRNGNLFKSVIAPDIIGGSEKDNIESLKRFKESYLGKNIIPVFHEGEKLELIQKYIDLWHNKIALGAIESRGKPKIHDWLDSIFKEFPPSLNLSFHGLGMTQKTTILYYRDFFESVDSTTWLSFNKYGIEANKYLLNDRSNDFLLKLGLLVLEDMEKHGESKQITKTQKEMVAVKTGKNLLDLIKETGINQAEELKINV